MRLRHQLAASIAPIALAALAALSLALPHEVEAQRRPGAPTGFYTTTGLVTLEVEGGSVSSTTSLSESPSFALSTLLTGPLMKRAKRAWIVGARGGLFALGNKDRCVVTPFAAGCQSRKFTERAMLLTGGALDIRSTVLRVLAGPALYQVEDGGTRVGTALRIDYAAPRLRGPTPTLFVTRSFMGSQGGESVGITTLGAGFRWMRKR